MLLALLGKEGRQFCGFCREATEARGGSGTGAGGFERA